MSATQAWPNVAEDLCQSKYNFGSYSTFGDGRFFVSPCSLRRRAVAVQFTLKSAIIKCLNDAIKGLGLHVKPSERRFSVYFCIGFGVTWLLQTRNRYFNDVPGSRPERAELSWVYLAKIKNFKDEKEIIAIAKTPGHRKKQKVIESFPLDWWTKVHSKPNLHRSYSLCGKELPDDQHSCAGSVGSQPVSLSGTGAQIRKDLGVANKVQTQLKRNSARVVITLSHLASSINVCSGCRMRLSHPMQPSYRWNGEAESSWGRVFCVRKAPCSNFIHHQKWAAESNRWV